MFLNSPRGFRSSLEQRAHFISFSFLSHLYQPSFESFVMLVFEAQPAILTSNIESRSRFDPLVGSTRPNLSLLRIKTIILLEGSGRAIMGWPKTFQDKGSVSTFIAF